MIDASNLIQKARSHLPLLIFGGFALVAALLWMPRGSSDAVAEAPALKELEARLSSGSQRLADLIEVTNERPVFHASRRPIATPEAPKAPEPELSLLGVIAEDNGETLAFVKVSTTGALFRIGKGETVGRWRILEIGTEAISVSKDGQAPYTLRIGG
ncbi:MAG: hypothetical protein AAF718_09330 [Pseudomonadota bacterium]